MKKIHDGDDYDLKPISPQEMMLYASLACDRKIFLNQNVTKASASVISSFMYYYDSIDGDTPIELYIHSNGGDVDGFFNIYDTMCSINAPVHTICMGKAYSAGAFLLCSGASGYRSAFESSDIMIHGIQCAFPVTKEQEDSMEYLDFLNKKNVAIMSIVAKKTGKNIKQVLSDCSRDLFLTPKEALKYGLIDNIISGR